MHVLEKIIKEIEDEITRSRDFYNNEYRQGLAVAQEIIRSHMEDDGTTQDSRSVLFEDDAGFRMLQVPYQSKEEKKDEV